MKKRIAVFGAVLSIFILLNTTNVWGGEKQTIKTLYIPLADHYAGIVAYEKYRDEMKQADYVIERIKSPGLVRAYFMSGEADMAYTVCPMAMDMFAESPTFRFVSLLHRDGNALAINERLNDSVQLPEDRSLRRPDGRVAAAFSELAEKDGNPVECAVPDFLATHTVVLYKYLRDHGKEMNFGFGSDKDVLAVEVSPPDSPAFLKRMNSRDRPAAFEQSLPWADVVEVEKAGVVAWYSKDVIPWPNGHVECIAIATDRCIEEKKEALKEVIYYLHKAGIDIENAREAGGEKIVEISDMIRKHIPEHSHEAIIESLDPSLRVINYRHLNVDKAGLNQIMELAIEGGMLKGRIDIDAFTSEEFSTTITEE
jgi:NitT/TauT family transport system substrate-binding protein